MFHVSHHLILTRFFVANLDGWFGCYSTDLLPFDLSLLYYYINPWSFKIQCLFFEDTYLPFGISLSNPVSLLTVSELFSGDWGFCNFISNFITYQITSCFCSFINYFFEAILSASVADCLAWSRRFWLYIPLTFWLMFLLIFLLVFLAKDKGP